MKNKLYYIKRLGCFVFIIDKDDKNVTFSSAHFLADVFTTILRYEVNTNIFLDLFKPVEVTIENINNLSSRDNLINEVKAIGVGESFKFSTRYGLQVSKNKTDISRLYKDKFKELEKEVISFTKV
jgi:hypothetical protein